MCAFAKRCAKEILRDPINLLFGLGFPILLLLLMTAIQSNVPVALFEMKHLAPGIAVFSLSFLTLFSATLIAKDAESALLRRLFTTPLSAFDFILGYTLPMLPIALLQGIVCYLFATVLGLPVTRNLLSAILMILPISMVYISLGLLCGSLLSVKQVGGICGALLTNVSALLSGAWFDLDLVGGVFRKVASFLPFYHAVELERGVVRGQFAMGHLGVVLAYALVLSAAAVFAFLRKINRQ